MSKRLALVLNVLALSTIVSVAVLPQTTIAAPDETTQTEDIIYLEDGRILKGEVISETNTEVVFEIIHREFNIRSKMTFARADVSRIDHDVEIPAAEAGGASVATTASTTSEDSDPWARTFGTRRGASHDESLPSFYFVPMKGQMGTDVHTQVYMDMVDDIRLHNPDYLVFVMNTNFVAEDIIVPEHDFDGATNDKNLDSLDFLDMYRDLVNVFRDEMPDIRQIMWVEDSDGIGSIMAMAWEDMYMKPDAKFGGASQLAQFWAGLGDNIDGKYREGMMALLKGFALYGNYATELVDGMVRREKALSATWKGREVIWSLDKSGDYLVDDGERGIANFTARTAEDFLISKGTAETLDDLALLLGEREYRIVDGKSEEIFEKYVTDWRRLYTNCMGWISDLNQLPRLRLDGAVLLGRQKKIFENLLKAIDRYQAIEVRMAMDFGIDRLTLITQIEIIKERLRAMQGGRGGGGGGGGAGSGRGIGEGG